MRACDIICCILTWYSEDKQQYTNNCTIIMHNRIQACGSPPTCCGLFRSPSGRYWSVKISTFWACANWNYPCCVHISATAPQSDGWKEPKYERGLPHVACNRTYSAVGAEMATSLTAWNIDNFQIKC